LIKIRSWITGKENVLVLKLNPVLAEFEVWETSYMQTALQGTFMDVLKRAVY